MLLVAQADPKNQCRALHTIYSNIAAVYAMRHDWKLSYNYAHQSVTLHPAFAKGHSRMATALSALKFYKEARVAYETCLNIDPQNKHAKDQIAEIDRKLANPSPTSAAAAAAAAAATPPAILLFCAAAAAAAAAVARYWHAECGPR